ncbi:hypothetical protein MAPG_00475 [Magnaporthiopsis poae ATCC 64411]|uniref:Archaemetzincin-2 n=1 Tax=Magnaporthiopsis poae (strain ATCC 64411 / 73-15) TaxID=644358 RepID=A0A0C4DL38_MAGP6|nr:hypothetical protein MAPG_00475 [Magnaporthiopsis poae ATCC 64411]
MQATIAFDQLVALALLQTPPCAADFAVQSGTQYPYCTSGGFTSTNFMDCSCKRSGGYVVESSPHAKEVGFKRATHERRLAATTASGRVPNPKQDASSNATITESDLALAFPAPLVLPGDDLALDPSYPPQSLRSWKREPERNKITRDRQIIYVAAPPVINANVKGMGAWSSPKDDGRDNQPSLELPKVAELVAFLSAFYHGLPVKELDEPFEFFPWEADEPKRKRARGGTGRGKAAVPEQEATTPHVGLRFRDGCTRVRTRPCPDGVFSRQLCLSDMLDAVLEMVPQDAYAVLLLADHDTYEDEDDDFCCGRAFGGSRIAVVSSARYHPMLDPIIDRPHMWPASHCRDHVASLCDGAATTAAADLVAPSPMRSALDAAAMLRQDAIDLVGLWFSRVCRTAAHELGHCLGLDHCVYYACIMQGTAGMAEDYRQPPYTCPICSRKLAHAVATELGSSSILLGDDAVCSEDEYLMARNRALLLVCQKWPQVAMFAGYCAWLEGVMARKQP